MCASCNRDFVINDAVVKCPTCRYRLHVICASKVFLGEREALLPDSGSCPFCLEYTSWAEFVQNWKVFECKEEMLLTQETQFSDFSETSETGAQEGEPASRCVDESILLENSTTESGIIVTEQNTLLENPEWHPKTLQERLSRKRQYTNKGSSGAIHVTTEVIDLD